jgi:hypothetical protein
MFQPAASRYDLLARVAFGQSIAFIWLLPRLPVWQPVLTREILGLSFLCIDFTSQITTSGVD